MAKYPTNVAEAAFESKNGSKAESAGFTRTLVQQREGLKACTASLYLVFFPTLRECIKLSNTTRRRPFKRTPNFADWVTKDEELNNPKLGDAFVGGAKSI